MLEKFGERCEKFVRAFMPDPFVLVLLLTITTFALSQWLTNTTHTQVLQYWNTGFWELLNFAMQMVLIVVTGEAIADAPVVQKLLKKIASVPRNAKRTLFGLTLFSIVLGWLHWGFGLVMASLLARETAKSLHKRKIQIHYPLVATAAYTSMLLWHAGTTASAPLLINTPGHFLEKTIGLIPLSETIFLPSNLIVCIFLTLTIPIVVTQLSPKRNIRGINEFDVDLQLSPLKKSLEKPRTFAEKLERSYVTNLVIGGLSIVFMYNYFQQNGLNLTHNIVNFIFLALGMLLHRNPVSYAKSISNSVKATSGIILQFPFYGGIMGIMRETGLGHMLASFFIDHASKQTLPLMAYFASVVTKLFIPSGGGEWAVEGPVMIQAAKELGSPIGLTTMAIAYGNMVGNMFQPFWAIPLLSIMGLKARDIMGYCLVIFFFVFPILAVALWST